MCRKKACFFRPDAPGYILFAPAFWRRQTAGRKNPTDGSGGGILRPAVCRAFALIPFFTGDSIAFIHYGE